MASIYPGLQVGWGNPF